MNYWQYVRHRAYLEARDYVRDHFGRAMTVAVVSLAAVVAVRLFGSEGDWWNDLVAVAVWLAAVALVFGWLFLVRLFAVPVKMRKASLAAARAAREDAAHLRARIDGLVNAPRRMPFSDLATVAESDLGWDFRNHDKMHFTDFINAIRQAAVDQHIVIEGRQGCMKMPKHLRESFVFDSIPPNYMRLFRIDVPKWFQGTDNYDITTNRDDDDDASRFRDLHVTNGAKAVEWLSRSGEEWKGRTKSAHDEHQERTQEFLHSIGLGLVDDDESKLEK